MPGSVVIPMDRFRILGAGGAVRLGFFEATDTHVSDGSNILILKRARSFLTPHDKPDVCGWKTTQGTVMLNQIYLSCQPDMIR